MKSKAALKYTNTTTKMVSTVMSRSSSAKIHRPLCSSDRLKEAARNERVFKNMKRQAKRFLQKEGDNIENEGKK